MLAPLLRSRVRGRHTDARASGGFSRPDGGTDHFDGVIVGAGTIAERARSAEVHEGARAVVERLEPDDYAVYVCDFMEEGRRRAGDAWSYADITTVLYAATELLQPESYLEIGVRRARSMAAVASLAPSCSIIGIDMWMEGYGGADNPGEEFVRQEVAKVGFEGELELISGNSHKVLPRLFAERPDLDFDLITVDGDHSVRGAARDLHDVLPRLRIGGVLVFDDVRHPLLPKLHDVWQRVVTADRRYITWEFEDIGYGVGLAVRRW